MLFTLLHSLSSPIPRPLLRLIRESCVSVRHETGRRDVCASEAHDPPRVVVLAILCVCCESVCACVCVCVASIKQAGLLAAPHSHKTLTCHAGVARPSRYVMPPPCLCSLTHTHTVSIDGVIIAPRDERLPSPARLAAAEVHTYIANRAGNL